MGSKATSSRFDPDAFLATVNRGRTMSEYRSGQIIFSQGDPADSVFYVVRGKIKVAVLSELFGKRDFFGEGCLIAQPLRLATAASMTDTLVMRIEKTEMVRVLRAEPSFAE